jgi:hypothetical protein
MENRSAFIPVFLALAWTSVQFFFTLMVLQSEPGVGLGCSRDLPRTALTITMAGTAAAGIASVGFLLAGRPRQACVAVAVELVFVIGWIAVGGFGAYDCVLDV